MGVQTNIHFQGKEDLCKLNKEYLNAVLCKFRLFLSLTIEKLSNGSIFLPTL